MTSDAAGFHRYGRFRRRCRPIAGRIGAPDGRLDGSPIAAAALALLLAGIATVPARAAELSYPFEGTWVRSNRVCAANAPLVRTYTARDVVYPSGRCTVRKVAAGGGQWEIFEECRKAERPGNYTETIRMLGPDLMQSRRQAARLKIARWLRFTRCTVAAPGGPATPPLAKAVPAAAPHRPAEEHPDRPPEPKPAEP